MSEREAKKIVDRARSHKTCVRYRVGADGMVMFAPNGAPVSSPIFGLKPIALGLGLLVGAAALPSTGASQVMGAIEPQRPTLQAPVDPTPTVVEPPMIMGEMAPPPVEKKAKRKKAPPPPPRHEEIMGDLAPEPEFVKGELKLEE